MDASRFDDVVRLLTNAPSRRGVLAGLATAVPGLTLPAVGDAGKGKKRKKKVKRNEFGCVNVGGKCRGKDALCCSGLCEGKKPKKRKRDKSRCVAHDVGDCQAGENTCDGPAPCTTTTGASGDCFRTTGNTAYCSAGSDTGAACTTDDECLSDCGPGSACIFNCAGNPVCKGLDISCGVG
jgi:hypothetical protein